MDFTRDSRERRPFRTLNLMDGFTREARRIEVDTSLPGSRVCGCWKKWRKSGISGAMQVDNGPEFISRRWKWAMRMAWACTSSSRAAGAECVIESFNGKFRDECLNQNWLVSLEDGREDHRSVAVDYNTVGRTAAGISNPGGVAAEIGGEKLWKDAAGKSTNHFSPALGNPATRRDATFHSPGGDELIPRAAEQIQSSPEC